MQPRARLEANLVSESEAYGYTLSVWGTGALLIHAFGVPDIARILAFVAGALLGFAALALVAFDGVSAEATTTESPSSLVVSTIHVVATGGTLLLADALVVVGQAWPPVAVFLAAGVLVTVAYNLLLLLEAGTVQAAT